LIFHAGGNAGRVDFVPLSLSTLVYFQATASPVFSSAQISAVGPWQVYVFGLTIYSESRSWRTRAPDFGGGLGGMWAGNSGDKSPAVQTRWPGRTKLRASVRTARA